MDIEPFKIPLSGKNAEFECSAGSTTMCSLSEPNCLYLTPKENHPTSVQAVTKSFPSPFLSYVKDANEDLQVPHVERLKAPESQSSSNNEFVALNPLRNVHVSTQLMEDFLQLARGNTKKDLETCGILCAILDKEIFYVTTLIIPKQESTSNSCQAKYEEEYFAIQHEHSLFPVGWIHTHPSQSCFMSSVDLHTHYSYQLLRLIASRMPFLCLQLGEKKVMVPEAFAVVMAPTDKSRSYGIFRLTDRGMHILRDCQEKSFHQHKEPIDGHPIYQQCSNVYTNSHLR